MGDLASLRTLLASVILLWPAPVVAQAIPPWRITLDNDFFNFWMAEDDRPDRDYTQGFEIERAIGTTSFASRVFFPGLKGCRDRPLDPTRCATMTISLRQEIYTATPDTLPQPPAGERQNLGWLALGAGVQRVWARGVDEFAVQVGVTGPPSLSEAAQKTVHRLFGFGRRGGWDRQVPFEPGLVLSYRGARVVAAPSWRGRRLAAVAAFSRLRLGNIVTDGRLGGCVAIGWNVGGCADPLPPASDGASLGLIASVSGDLVVRNIGLDGSTFTSRPRVVKRWLVAESAIGVRARVFGVGLSWIAITRGREYVTQRGSHTYSRIQVTF